jgi:hypothetical protein
MFDIGYYNLHNGHSGMSKIKCKSGGGGGGGYYTEEFSIYLFCPHL